MLHKALQIASCAHKNHKRRNGEAYINHPLRVMAKMTTEAERCVAILHDVVEDTHVTLDDLRVFFTDEIVEAIDLLTKENKLAHSYFTYIQVIAKNPLARAVKIADLEDNMDIKQLLTLEENDFTRLQKYHQSYQILTDYTQPQ